MASLPSFESCYDAAKTDTVKALGVAATQQWKRYASTRDSIQSKITAIQKRYSSLHWEFNDSDTSEEQFAAYIKEFDDIVRVGDRAARFWRTTESINTCREYLGDARYVFLTVEEREKQPEAAKKIDKLRKECLEPKAVEIWVAAEKLEALVGRMEKVWEVLMN